MADIYRETIDIPVSLGKVSGNLAVPEHPKGLVIFAHGSGSSRMSSRNKFVADYLNNMSLATLVFDLLTEFEDLNYDNRFNIDLLAHRLVDALVICEKHEKLKNLDIGYFGASTGAAAAVLAAVRSDRVKTIVSRGGRPDMVIKEAAKLDVPILLIIGGADPVVIDLNREFYDSISCEKELSIIDGATHLFVEPGTLEKVAEMAGVWFLKYLALSD